MITHLGIPSLPIGVNETLGMCGSERNSYQQNKAAAYSINKGTMITVATSEVIFIIFFALTFHLTLKCKILAFSNSIPA
jgi:hypothetical protein